jgi:hypothetical protein
VRRLTEPVVATTMRPLPRASVSFYPLARARAVLAGGPGMRTGEIAPHLRFVKTGPESSRIELANAGQLTVNRGLVLQ